ncbi:hypothetical protein AB0870_13765 [Microbacterium proteolyticum]|uniref:DUF7882 family protein n=1 Tax=Microbacterium TaxID=33882 RepID=UPI002416DE0B|nr:MULTISPECIES: hypothetical protein [Microbacterium]MDI9890920.1 hypothetical protein [Microbacterium sp. IEGM 1404]
MARLYYGTDLSPVTFPDRLMAYVKVITSTKLRRNESFTLTWTGDPENPGRSAIWLHPSIPMRFVFDSADAEQLVGDYLRALADQANASAGLVIDLRTWQDDESSLPRTPAQHVAPRRPARPVRAA